MLFDTHCHLDAPEFEADRDAVYEAAYRSGVDRLLIPAVNAENFAAVRDCCRRYIGCLPAYGIHPQNAGSAQEDDLKTLRHWLRREATGPHPPVAVGEIGLDFFETKIPPQLQIRYFDAQLKIAAAANLPVILHVRRAVDAILKQLQQSPVRGGIAHAFNGSRQQADAFFAKGFCLGFGGAMTYAGSTRIRGLAATLPLEAIVLETDAPDIPPAWLSTPSGRRRNTPDQLARVAQVLADLRSISVETVIAVTTANALRCLGISGRPSFDRGNSTSPPL